MDRGMWASRRNGIGSKKEAPTAANYAPKKEHDYELSTSQKLKIFVDDFYNNIKKGVDATNHQTLLRNLETVCDCFPVKQGYSYKNVDIALGSIVPNTNENWDIEATIQPRAQAAAEGIYNFGVKMPAAMGYVKSVLDSIMKRSERQNESCFMMPVVKAEKNRAGINKLSNQLNMYISPVVLASNVNHFDDYRRKLFIDLSFIGKNRTIEDRHRKVMNKTFNMREFADCNRLLNELNEKLMKNAPRF